MAPPADPDDPPFVEIDGRRFYADRCYLNAMAGRDDNNDDDDAGAAANPGIQLFSRRRLVAALSSSEGLEVCV